LLLPFVTISPLGDRQYELWFNIDAPGNKHKIAKLSIAPNANQIGVYRETGTTPNYRAKITPTSINPTVRNVFIITLPQISNYMRFIFDLSKINLESRESLKTYALNSGINFIGQKGDEVTAFVRAGQ
jgi:hypothetical protein